VIGKVNIFGHIGDSFVDEAGTLHKGTNLLDVIEQVESFPQATQIEISINSPGGYVDVGDSIYDYLLSLKKQGKQLITIQSGLVGSIATKLFLAGDRRIADDRYEFWIHNPFQENVSGDADALQAAANAVADTEKALRKFYAEFTSISDEGLDALMKNETGLTADQCIKFKFATEKKLAPAFNAIKTTIKKAMANTKQDEKSFMEHVKAFFNTEKPKGQQPKKAEIPGGGDKQSLVVTLAEGAGSFWVEGEAVVEGAPAFLLDEAGQPTAEPLADGEYMLEDGSKLTVAGGLVTAVMPAEEEAAVETPLTAEAVAEMINAALAKAQEGSLAEIAKIKKESEDKIMALKSTLKLGVQPTKAVLNNNGVQKLEYKSIAQKMAEKAEERKKQLNKN
jgi:ATP-dependent protease ClpP protease subunit